MGKTWLVCKREYVDNIRTKTFWIGVLAVPVIYVIMIALVIVFSKAKDARKFAVIDESGWLVKELERQGRDRREGKFERIDYPLDGSEEELRKKLDRDEIFAFFVIGEDPVGKKGQYNRTGKYVSNNLTDDDLRSWFARNASRIVRSRRIAAVPGLDKSAADWIAAPVSFEEKRVTKGGREKKVENKEKADQYAPIAFVIILWISVMVIIQMLITNMIEEKSNRIIEVLLSSVSPLQLMTGKILGLAATGFSIVGSWAVFLLFGLYVLPYFSPQAERIMGEIGISAILTNPVYIGSFLAYFVLGYLLYAVVIAGIGSVFNSLKEAQNVVAPLMIVMMVPYLASFQIVSDPNGTLARVMSYIPPFTPFVMMGRAAGSPPILDYVMTGILLIVCIALGFYLAAKIFRIGILMTGKPPKVREILRWMRAPIGTIPQTEE